MSNKRVVVAGISVNTPPGDAPAAFLGGLLAGRPALSRWKCFASEPIYGFVGRKPVFGE